MRSFSVLLGRSAEIAGDTAGADGVGASGMMVVTGTSSSDL